MRVRYDPEADVLLLILRDEPPADAAEEPGGIVLRHGRDGLPVSVELLNASARNRIQSDGVSVTFEYAAKP